MFKHYNLRFFGGFGFLSTTRSSSSSTGRWPSSLSTTTRGVFDWFNRPSCSKKEDSSFRICSKSASSSFESSPLSSDSEDDFSLMTGEVGPGWDSGWDSGWGSGGDPGLFSGV